MLSVGIITAPRKQYYLGTSLESYFQQWDIAPHVFAEPDTPKIFAHHKRVIWHQNSFQKGNVFNWIDSLKWMWENTYTTYIMMCEDDIEWRSGSGEELRSILLNGVVRIEDGDLLRFPEIGFISPYCSEKNQWELGERDVWTKPRKSQFWMGALSICMHRDVVGAFLTHLNKFFFHANWHVADGKFLHLDYAIGQVIINQLHLPIVAHNPTLVLHIGDVSTYPTNNDVLITTPACRLPAL